MAKIAVWVRGVAPRPSRGVRERASWRRALLVSAAVVLGTIVAGCGANHEPTPSFCDGIDARIGGCDPDRPRYTGTTCTEVGGEFGRQLDARLVAIYRGPDVVNGESKAVRAANVTGVALSLANLHLRRLGLIRDCDAREFIAAAAALFSPDVQAEAGKYLYDGVTVTYAEWLSNLESMASILDQLEDAPSPSP